MNRLLALSGLLLACFARTLLAVDNAGATAGKWTYDVPAARQLASATDRPLLVMFSNTSGKCAWCNKFEKEIDSSEEWLYYASEQQLAMAFLNYNGPNWDEDYYVSLASSNQTDITGFPAFVLYTSDGSNVLTAFSFNATDTTYSASAFISRIDDALESGDVQLNGRDLWDPADDTATGATVLTFESYNLRQGHTLNKVSGAGVTDTDDWFKFLCVKGRKYFFQIPSYDYSANASTTVTNSQSHTYSNGVPLAGFSTNTVIWPASTNWSVAAASTNQIFAHYETWDITLTNTLYQIVTNAVLFSTNYPAFVASENYTETVQTNLPAGNPEATTNDIFADVSSPLATFYDPSLQTRIAVDAGPLGTAEILPLTALTNGCLFTAPDAYANSYCFLHVRQETTNNNAGSTGGMIVLPPATNVTVETAYTNLTEYSVTAETVSNAWWRTSYGDNNGFGDMLVTESLIAEVKTRTITNAVSLSETHSVTNFAVTLTTNYVTYAYDATAYRLNYRYWDPGEVAFSSTNVTVSESAASVKLTVTRKGGSSGAVKIAFSCRDDTAEDGLDYKAAGGELYWADNQSGSTNITVDLIQDLRPAWEGDERFFVALKKSGDAPWFQAAVGASSNAAVTLKESTAKSAGKLTFAGYGDDATPFDNPSKPALTVREDDAFTLWVARVGGSNGTASVTLSTSKGSASAGTDFVAQTETLTWEDNEFEPQAVTFYTLGRDPFTRDLQFSVKLSHASGATLGSPAAVTVTVRDERVAYSLADTAADAAAAGATFKAASALWFWADEEKTTLRSEPLSRGGKASLKLTLTGPGVLSFDWAMNDWADADTLVCAGGVLLSKTLSDADGTASVLLKPGKQTVTWTYKKASDAEGEAYASLRNLLWQPLPKAVSPDPASGSRINPSALSWSSTADISYILGRDFSAGDDGLDVTRTAVAVSPKGLSLPNSSGSATFDDLWDGAEPKLNAAYKWRVDTVFAHEDGTLVNTGDAWSFTAIGASEDTGVPPDGESEPGVYPALQGVACSLGALSGEGDGVTYAVVGGALPTGLKLTAATGEISGVPTRAGTWAVTLQATEADSGTRTPRNSSSLTIIVYPLGDFAGTYSGWTETDSEELPYTGAGSATISQAGDLSAKFTVSGTAYTFKKKGFDAADNLEAPAYVEIASCEGATVTDSEGKHTHSLDAVSVDTNGNLTAELTLYTLSKNSDGTTTATPTAHRVALFRNSWDRSDRKALLTALSGYYTVSLPVTAARDETTSPLGSSYLTLTVGAKGSAKASGVLADGNTWSLATTLIGLDPDSEDDAEAAAGAADVYIFATPSAYSGQGGFCGRLRITAGATHYDNVVTCPDSSGTLQWWNAKPTCVYGATGATASDSSGFLNAVTPAGGYYDSVMNLQTFYLYKSLTFQDSPLETAPGTAMIDRIPTDYDGRDGTSGYEILTAEEGLLPFGTALAVGAKTLTAAPSHVTYFETDLSTMSLIDNIDFSESTNASGLSLSLTRATGLLSGSFNLFYETTDDEGAYVRYTRKVAVKGIYAPARLREEDEDPSAGTQGAGFYLIPDSGTYSNDAGKSVSYLFNWSFAFDLLAEQE